MIGDCFSGVDQNDQNVQTVGNIIKGKDITLTMTNKGIEEIFVALWVFLTTFMRPPASTFILFQGTFLGHFFCMQAKMLLEASSLLAWYWDLVVSSKRFSLSTFLLYIANQISIESETAKKQTSKYLCLRYFPDRF